MKDVVTAALLLSGSCFMFLAALGVLRMPDLFTRMQPATKAATIGVFLMFAAVAVHYSSSEVTARVVAGIAFVVITAPVAAHMIGRAAYSAGERLWEGTVIDEWHGDSPRGRKRR